MDVAFPFMIYFMYTLIILINSYTVHALENLETKK